MFKSSTRICFYFSSRIRQQLKILNLKIPTSQQQIKTKYRQLAKQYHPDTLKSSPNQKKSQQHFVIITTAYNTLKQLSQKQLSGQNEQQYDINIQQPMKQKIKTKQQQLRQQTYDSRKANLYSSMKKDKKDEKPLYKTIPELFIGTFFVIIMFGEWIYKSAKRTEIQIQIKQKQKQDFVYQNVFKGFNAAKRFKTTTHNIPPEINKQPWIKQ